jgi:hypothetical protein
MAGGSATLALDSWIERVSVPIVVDEARFGPETEGWKGAKLSERLAYTGGIPSR